MSITNVGSVLYTNAARALEAARKGAEAKKTEAAISAGSPDEGDKVTISSRGSDLGRLVELSKAAPEVDGARVAALKSSLEDGSLRVDSRELAAKMFQEMSLESLF
ncbi:MAG: flagellar biosynthesis anti-sigma factor FlgM [Deltaproteobacteria bacterium]|nr:flagellar biosynthesis anti-sigma factor FlgM [Deltaproteobacteria bacterium]